MARGRGQPTKLNQWIRVPTPDNARRRVKVSDYICELMEANGWRATLCADMVGVSRNTIKEWLRRGEDAEKRVDLGHNLTPEDQRYLDFLSATRGAHARWIRTHTEIYDSLAKGGLTVSEVIQEVDPTIIETRDDGTKGPKILKTRTKTQRMLPSESALRTMLERMAVDADGSRVFAPRVEVTGEDGGPVLIEDKEARAAAISRELAVFQMGVESAREVAENEAGVEE